jgi:DeoR/GlpR family transcriptional regulator of sugar metabolism
MSKYQINKSFVTAQTRGSQILEAIQSNGYESISNLAQALAVSEMTIRRDIERLEGEGLIRRTHGGAVSVSRIRVGIDFRVRQEENREEKDQIGRLAANLVREGQTIFLDAGSTVLAMVKYLKDFQRLQIVTNSLPVQEELTESSNLDVVLVGGRLLKLTLSLVGTLAVDNLANLRFDWAFLGTNGIDLTRGLTHNTLEEIPVKRAAASSATQAVVLADSRKFCRNSLSMFLPIDKIHMIVTDGPIEGLEAQLKDIQTNLKVLWPGKNND